MVVGLRWARLTRLLRLYSIMITYSKLSPIYVIASSSFIYDIILEIPGKNLLSSSERYAFERATLKVLAGPTCESDYVTVNTVGIKDQSVSANGSFLILQLGIDATSETIDETKAKAILANCIKENGWNIKNGFDLAMGYSSSSETGEKMGFFESVYRSEYFLMTVIFGVAVMALGFLIIGLLFVQKKKRRRQKEIDEIIFRHLSDLQLSKDRDGNSSVFSQDANHLNDIEQIMSMVLSGQGLSRSNESRSFEEDSQISYLTSEVRQGIISLFFHFTINRYL